MFVQVIQGHVSDRTEIRDALNSWMQDLAPGAEGWLGTTAGVTTDDTFIAFVRFESAEAAQRNGHRPEQHEWWMETSKLFAGDVAFRDSVEVDTFLDGGSDDAGFVQVIQGRTQDANRLWELNRRSESALKNFRPEVIGGMAALHSDGTVTQAVYFTSESAAREGERKTPPPELSELYHAEQELLSDLRYYDLTEPWLYSPSR